MGKAIPLRLSALAVVAADINAVLAASNMISAMPARILAIFLKAFLAVEAAAVRHLAAASVVHRHPRVPMLHIG